MKTFITEADMSEPENYSKACELIDIRSYIDYFATEIYIGNRDWPGHNYACWRTREPESGLYGDGRWRWMLFDVNLSLDIARAEEDDVSRACQEDEMFASLMNNDGFRKELYSTLLEMAEKDFAPEKMIQYTEAYKAKFESQIKANIGRFYGINEITMAKFDEGLDEKEQFFTKRSDFIIRTYS